MRYLVFVLTLLFSMDLCAQQTPQLLDGQWYVKGGYPIDPSSQPLSWPPTSGFPSMVISLDSIAEACPDCYPDNDADDDLFIIYSDGTHYNSRYDAARLGGALPDWSNPNGNGSIHGFTGHLWKYDNTTNIDSVVFNVQAPQEIQYLYWTNKYDEDDPPPVINNSQHLAFPLNTIVGSDYPPSGLPVITANHDIVEGKDITLIVKNTACLNNGFTLTYNLVSNPLSVALFNTSHVFPNNSATRGPATLSPNTLNSLECTTNGYADPYFYINLRPTSDLIALTSGSGQSVEVEFVITPTSGRNCSPYILRESVRQSHDPNFLVARFFCKTVPNLVTTSLDTVTFIVYEGQFQNDGETSENNIILKVNLPDDLKNAPVSISEVAYGGQPISYESYRSIRLPEFHNTFFWQDTLDELIACKHPDASDYSVSVAKFKLCVGPLPSDFDPEYHTYMIDSAAVFFDGSREPMRILNEIPETVLSGEVNIPTISFKIVTSCSSCLLRGGLRRLVVERIFNIENKPGDDVQFLRAVRNDLKDMVKEAKRLERTEKGD